MASSAAVCLFLLFGWKINAVMMVVLPFFGLGLGVNDMFVFVRHFSEQVVKADVNQGSSDGTPAPQRNAEDITCAMLAGAGPGAMLTSTCNCVTFTFGALIMPVPALADFCAAAALVVALNYFVMLTQVVPLLSWTARRAVMSQQACACTSSCDNMEAQCFQSWTAGVSKLEKKITKMTSLSFGCLTFSLWPCALILLVVSGVLINDKDIGYNPAEAVKDGSPQYRAVEVFFDEFSSFPAFLCFDDVDVPSNQREMLTLFGSLVGPDQRHTEAFGLNFLTAFYFQHAPQIMAGKLLVDPSWNSSLAPFGTVKLDSTDFYQYYHDWSRVPLENPMKAMDPNSMGYVTADLAWTNEFSYASPNKSLAPALRFSFFSFFIVGLQNQNDFVVSIRQANELLEQSPLKGKASIYGATFTFWSVLLDLDSTLWRILGLSLAIVFTCTLICSMASSPALSDSLRMRKYTDSCRELLGCFAVAVISTLACAMIVGEVYGLSTRFLKFNMFVAMTLLAASGIAIEFVAHLVTAFLQEPGTPQERMVRAVATTAPAILQSSFSTVIGILPMSLSSFAFVVKYMFGMFALVQAIGLLNGLVFLPAFLGSVGLLFGPNTKEQYKPDVNVSSENLPRVLDLPGGAATSKNNEKERV